MFGVARLMQMRDHVTSLHPAFVLHHLLIGIVLLILSTRSWNASGRKATRRLVAVQSASSVLVFLVLSLVAAGMVTLIQETVDGFLFVRLLAQTLFFEFPVLVAVLVIATWRARRRALSVGLAVVVLATAAVYVEAFAREPMTLEVRHHSLDLTHGRPEAGSLRIVHLSDIQTPAAGSHDRAALHKALGLSPDLLVLTGDYVHTRIGEERATALAGFHDLLVRERLSAPLGIFAVQGDVDSEWPAPLDGLGFHLLHDQVVRVTLPTGRSLAIAGLAPRTSRGHDRLALRGLLRSATAADLTLVIGHSPDFILSPSEDAPPDLALAGHTHGGQVALPFFGPPITLSRLPRQYASGLHRLGGVWLHVSAGVGMERGAAPQLRFLVPPEICLVEVTY